MHPRVYREFERICSERQVRGSVLEVGAVPSDASLLCMDSLKNAGEKIGVNLDGPHEYRDFRILKANANDMDCFEDDRFDAVLCNATLEHDRYFWKSVGEIRRVTKIGGFIVIGVPGYTVFKFERIKSSLRKNAFVRRLMSNRYLNPFFTSTLTYQMHNSPGDYYRFSPQAFQDVFFDGMDDIQIRSILMPPRIVGVGIKRPA